MPVDKHQAAGIGRFDQRVHERTGISNSLSPAHARLPSVIKATGIAVPDIIYTIKDACPVFL